MNTKLNKITDVRRTIIGSASRSSISMVNNLVSKLTFASIDSTSTKPPQDQNSPDSRTHQDWYQATHGSD